ncbi:MAG: methyltransferase domain-containing protein [Alphaproteobacteria bacterium]|nr:methyltransferase domain-containing protein [Alphaproteobacteria bacterium]
MAASYSHPQRGDTEVPQIFDRALYRRRRARGLSQGEDRFLLLEAADGVAERLGAIRRRFHDGLDLASTPESRSRLSPYAGRWTALSLVAGEGGQLIGDEEALPFAPASFDLVASVLSLHAVNDLPGALAQIRSLLKPDGVFVAALFGESTLHELRAAFAAAELELHDGLSPRVSPFADVRSLGMLLQRAGFALPVADVERTSVNYKEFSKLTGDLRAMGEMNYLCARDRRPLTRRLLATMLARYQDSGTPDQSRFRASFDIVYLTGWAPHDSQPKPLRPGTATTRLADALGTVERRA